MTPNTTTPHITYNAIREKVIESRVHRQYALYTFILSTTQIADQMKNLLTASQFVEDTSTIDAVLDQIEQIIRKAYREHLGAELFPELNKPNTSDLKDVE